MNINKYVKPIHSLLRFQKRNFTQEFDFIKQKSFSKVPSANRRSLEEQYSSDNHTLLNSLYMYTFFQDNIGYVLHEPRTNSLIGIDLGEFEVSEKVIGQLESHYKTELKYIFSTHKHSDHIGGNEQWKKKIPNLKIVSGSLEPQNIPGANYHMKDLQTIEIGDICVCCLETPGHTTDHVSYIVTHVTPESTKTPFLFCADTLFIAGCGRLLGGTAEQLFYSLQKLINLPNETLVFCAHEYTQQNLRFAKMIEPDNPMIDSKLKQATEIRNKGEFTVGSKLMEERFYNPFIRCARDEHFKQITGEQDPVRVFAKIRKLKDDFK